MFPSPLRKRLSVALGAIALLVLPTGAQVAAQVPSAASSLVAGAKSHLFGGQYDPRSQAGAPAAVRPEWAGLIGEYGAEMARFYVLEDQGELRILSGIFDNELLRPVSPGVFVLPASGPHGALTVRFRPNTAEPVTGVEIGSMVYAKRPFDGPGDFFHIAPLKPVAELRRDALARTPPAESGSFRKPDLVELNKLDPTIKLDVRYATSRNFLGAPLYLEPRAYMQRPAAEAVARVSQHLHQLGYGLLIHDSYRHWYVTEMFWEGTPAEKRIFVANPAKGSKHNRGCAVDLTLYNLKTGEAIRMTGGYDEMSERSYPFYPGGTSRERWHRDLLRHAMEAEGFTVNE